MRLISSLLIAFILFSQGELAGAAQGDGDSLDPEVTSVLVESFNLRYDTPKDGINGWPKRQHLALKHLRQTQPDVVGMQEALARQLYWLDAQLPNYDFAGVGRDDGKRGGEFVPLLYNTQALEILDSGYFWLSKTPNVAGSIGWSANHPRIVTWGKFSQKNQVFFAFNAHFSHVSDLARQKSAEFLVNYIPTITAEHPVILMGDFNTLDSEPAYMTITARSELMLIDAGLADGNSPAHTYNEFGQSESKRIDYIFISKGLTNSDYTTHSIREGERYISDHYPISTRVSFKK